MAQHQPWGGNYLIVYDVLIAENQDSMRTAKRQQLAGHALHMRKKGPSGQEMGHRKTACPK